jgi:prolipoprotein diacylglyceryl transferase
VTKTWWGPFAVWEGGLGIWGGILFGTLAGCWIVRRRGASATAFMDAAAPGILIGQAVGRLGNYFNQELFGRPTDLPWGLRIDPQHRPDGYVQYATFHPTFLYEALWNLALAGFLVLYERLRPDGRPGRLFALYVLGYGLGRLWVEALRIDDATRIAGVRVNIWVSLVAIGASLASLALLRHRERTARAPHESSAVP